jgi:hypothetical protein
VPPTSSPYFVFYAGDQICPIGKIYDMAKLLTQIHKGKTPHRRHFIKEWMELREMEPKDLIRKLNDVDPSLPPIDKSQVYRWIDGQLPQPRFMTRIAWALSIFTIDDDGVERPEPDPSGIMRDPNLDWFARQVKDRSEDELRRLRSIVENAFPPRTGTAN